METLEQEISAIEQKLAEKKAELNKEELHTVVKEQIQEKMPEYQPQNPTTSSLSTDSGSSATLLPATPPTASVPAYLSDELKSKVQELVNMAFNQSIADAVKAASKLNNPALIDAFHDILVDQLYNTLIERGKLKKM